MIDIFLVYCSASLPVTVGLTEVETSVGLETSGLQLHFTEKHHSHQVSVAISMVSCQKGPVCRA